MPQPQPGDLLAVMTAGAYGAVQAGTYNTRALVPEVLVREGEWALVRPRMEVEELIALDRLPPGCDCYSHGARASISPMPRVLISGAFLLPAGSGLLACYIEMRADSGAENQLTDQPR